MGNAELTQQLETIFKETGDAHHEAFRQQDSEDREWPLWYAEHAVEQLRKLLKNDALTKSEVVALLMQASEEQAMRAPGSDWAKYYAQFFARRLG